MSRAFNQGKRDTTMKYKMALVLAATAAAMAGEAATHAALAQTPPGSVGIEEAPAVVPATQAGPRILVGAIGGFAPDYEGSNDYEFAAAPLASIRWAEGYGASLGPSTMRTF